jgi:hypothetical protein
VVAKWAMSLERLIVGLHGVPSQALSGVWAKEAVTDMTDRSSAASLRRFQQNSSAIGTAPPLIEL